MKEYFSLRISGKPFEMFSPIHFVTLAVLAAIFLFTAVLFRRANGGAWKRRFRYGFAAFLFSFEVFYTIWAIIVGDWSIKYSIPFHLCEASLIIGGILLLSRNYFLFEVLFFWGIGGSVQALLTPDLYYPFPHVMFFYFFAGHGAVIIAVLYMIFAEGLRPVFKSILRVFIFTNIYMLAIAGVNLVIGGNYLFICHKPPYPSLMDYLGKWPWYILSLEAVGAAMFFICYSPFAIRSLISRRNKRISGKHPLGRRGRGLGI